MHDNLKQKALVYFNKGLIDKAKTLYEKARKKNPNDPETLYMLGAIFGQKKNYNQAIKYFSKTIQLQPNAFVALCGLGKAQKEAGLYHDAEISYNKALNLQPDNPDLILEIAGVLLHLGNEKNAEKLLNDVLSRNPENVEAMHGLGEIHQSRREFDTAIHYYEKALSKDPKRSGTHHRLGFTLHCTGDYDGAIKHLKTALSLNPSFQEAYVNLATSQVTAGELEHADETLSQATKRWPNNIDIAVCKADLLEKNDDAIAAYKLIKPFLKKNVQHPSLAMVYLSICNKVNECEAAIEHMEKLIALPETPDKTREAMQYAIGDVYNKQEQYDKAYQHYKQANSSRPDTYNKIENALYIDSIINTFSYKHLSQNVRSSTNKKQSAFIVGMPRSGTSLVEQILQSHSEIAGAGELNDVGKIAHTIQPPLGSSVKQYPFNCEHLTSAILDKFSTEYYDKLKSISPTATYVTDKMPHNFLYLGLIAQLFPGAKIIHCRRNPIDTCLSIYFQNFHEQHNYANNLTNLGEYYLEYSRLMDHWIRTLNIEIYEISYENLVVNTAEEIKNLLQYMDVAWEDNCLQFHKSDRYIATASHHQVRTPIYNKSINRWKYYEKHLTPLIEILKPLTPDKQ